MGLVGFLYDRDRVGGRRSVVFLVRVVGRGLGRFSEAWRDEWRVLGRVVVMVLEGVVVVFRVGLCMAF